MGTGRRELKQSTNIYLVSLDGLLFLELPSLLPNPWTNVASTESFGEEFHGSTTCRIRKHLLLFVLNWKPRACLKTSSFCVTGEVSNPPAS